MVLFGVTASAQQKVSLPVVCAEPEFVGKILKEYKEEILFVGKDLIHGVKQLTLNIFLNPKTGTYSAVLVSTDASVICVVSSGEAGKILHNN
jgi:hypothetical protein